jgi:hypothetical protein
MVVNLQSIGPGDGVAHLARAGSWQQVIYHCSLHISHMSFKINAK